MNQPANSTGSTRLAHLRRFAHWMDDGIQVPGTRFRFGLDPVIGLVPGFGDAAGAVLAVGTLVEAVRLGVTRYTLSRIAFNITLDALVGAVPLVGDLFDAGWKANLKNIALIDRHIAAPAKARKADGLFVVLVIGAVIVTCVTLMFVSALFIALLLGAILPHR